MAEIVPRKGRLQVSKRGTHGFTGPALLATGGGLATSKTDLYAVGVILYMLLERGVFDLEPLGIDEEW